MAFTGKKCHSDAIQENINRVRQNKISTNNEEYIMKRSPKAFRVCISSLELDSTASTKSLPANLKPEDGINYIHKKN